MLHQLPELPFEKDALEPFLSSETLDYHHGKHHKAYIDNLNKLIGGTEFENKTLEDIILTSPGGIFNNSAQHWNHSFYWNCLSPNGGSEPSSEVISLLKSTFGSFDEFQTEFSQTAITTFGSGWAWLVQNENGSLEIMSTSNAGTPMTLGKTALLTCDVWEHAYYIDYRNARPKYIEAFWNIINWDFIAKNLQV